jgi:3-dehydroquinate synthetase
MLHIAKNLVQLKSTLRSTHSIVFAPDLLAIENNTLASILNGVPALIVTTKSVNSLYGSKLRRYLAARTPTLDYRIFVLSCEESSKTIDNVLAICEQAAMFNLKRRSRIVAMGGGVCTDLCGFAAAIYCRGVSHIKIPTTLLGIVDAGIGIKNGVNVGSNKNKLGTFYPPEYSILDPSFINTLDNRQIRCGMAESIKIALVSDRELFEIIENDGVELINSRFVDPWASAEAVVRQSAIRMLEQLNKNLHEVNDYARAVDLGHTFSPYLESISQYTLPHGEAVAIDMGISVLIGRSLGLLREDTAGRILSLIRNLGLPLYYSAMDPVELWRSLDLIRAHRDGRLNLVVPTDIGTYAFVDDLSSIGLNGLMALVVELREQNGEFDRHRAMVP